MSEREVAMQFERTAEERFGRVDVLVTCAGVLHSTPTHQVEWAEWDETLAVNLTATWASIRAVLPGMLERGTGRIITISSELGIIGLPNYAAYCASKGAIIAMTKAIAKEVAPHGVLVNSVAPGPVETPMFINSPEFGDDEYLHDLPLRRLGQPDEIARVVEFLAGVGGDFFVGQIVSPNGGAAI
jgi:NAD(P)-dependent dehydrogenase (short-subunit alcohol dehydrogenase family)